MSDKKQTSDLSKATRNLQSPSQEAKVPRETPSREEQGTVNLRKGEASRPAHTLMEEDSGTLALGAESALEKPNPSNEAAAVDRTPPPASRLPSGLALEQGGGGEIPGVIDINDPLLGQTVAGRFVLLSKLGEGGVGKVYCAEQQPLGRLVALKLLHAHSATDKEAKARFQREAVGMTRLTHPGLAAVYDFGEWEGQFFIAMEILRGDSMFQWLYNKFPFTTEQVVDVMSQMARALGAAHDEGLVHRDLKPENVMVNLDKQGKPQIKVVDWGLVLLQQGSQEERLTMEGVTVGTPHYMSPEQCQGKGVGPLSDIYAMGSILYEMLTGSTPFSGDNPMTVMMQQMMAQPQKPSARNPRVEMAPELEELALRCLAKSPAARPQSTEEFLVALESALAQSGEGGAGRVGFVADRHSRADAMGLPKLSDSVIQAPTAFADYTFFVVEASQSYEDSLTMQMWANGFTVKNSPDLQAALADVPKLKPTGLVVSLLAAPEELLQKLIQVMKDGLLQATSVVVLGPDDSIELMTLALEQGVFDYVPQSQIATKLAKSIRRMIRKKQRAEKRSLR